MLKVSLSMFRKLACFSSLLSFGFWGRNQGRFLFRDRRGFFGQTLLQRFHQIDHWSFGLGMRHRSDFSAAALGFNQVLQPSLVGVVVFVGLKGSGQAFNQLLRERPLLLFYLALVCAPVFSFGANFI